jgi:hypothetical protein
MKRFLMLLAVAAVAGGMYVAAAPGRTAHAGPTWKQYSALQKQVVALKKQVGQVKKVAADADGFVRSCLLTTNAGVAAVSVFGDSNANPTYGYNFTQLGGAQALTTALDIDVSASPGGYLQAVDPSCIGNAAAHTQTHSGSSSRLSLRAERTP